MKLNATKIKECAEWVEQHGLHPQACGASIQDFAKAMGIGERTAYRWLNMAEVAGAIAQARDKYAARIVFDVENALVKAAIGTDAEVTKEKGKAIDEVVKEYDPVTGKLVRETTTKKMVTVEAVRERRYYPPDVKAAVVVLTNLAGDRWKQKQDVTVGAQTGSSVQVTVGDQEAADALKKVLASGAKPQEPKDDTTE